MNAVEKEITCCASNGDNVTDKSYWNTRWTKKETGWDIGYASPAITSYMEQYPNKEAAILIPGCGNSYEAEYLVENGFTNITLIDIAEKAVESLKEKFKSEIAVRILCGDFFRHEGVYDLIIEQTFFCAIPPTRRKDYAAKMHSLLKDDGKLIGVMFDRQFDNQSPPFGGSSEEYRSVFEPFFAIKLIEECYNSIPARAGTEVFINMNKK